MELSCYTQDPLSWPAGVWCWSPSWRPRAVSFVNVGLGAHRYSSALSTAQEGQGMETAVPSTAGLPRSPFCVSVEGGGTLL